jgi:hypothetical protein
MEAIYRAQKGGARAVDQHAATATVAIPAAGSIELRYRQAVRPTASAFL